MNIKKYLILIIIFLFINELIQAIYRHYERKIFYNLAKNRAQLLNKPLIVYGDPNNGYGSRFFNLFMNTYGCGDEMVDIKISGKCKNSIESDILTHLKSKPNNYGIIFISCVLEYVDNIEETIKEIYRVAGSNENIFIITVGRYSLSAYFYAENNYGAKNIIYAPPKYTDITFEKLKNKLF